MARQIFSEFKKMLCLKSFYIVALSYLVSGMISLFFMKSDGTYSFTDFIYGFCKGYFLLGIVIPVFICFYIHSDYKNGTIRNLYAVVRNRKTVILVKSIAIAIMLLILQLFFSALSISLLIISRNKLQGVMTPNGLFHYMLYYVLLVYVAMICVSAAMLFQDTALACIISLLLIIPLGALEKILISGLPAYVKGLFLLSTLFKFNNFINVSYKVLYLLSALLYIIILVFISATIAKKESFNE